MSIQDAPPGEFPSAVSVISADPVSHFHLITSKVDNGLGIGPTQRCVNFEAVCSTLAGGKARIWIFPGYAQDIYLANISCCIAPDGTAIDTGAGDPLPGAGVYGVASFPAVPQTLQAVAKLLNDVASPRVTYTIRNGKIWCGATPAWLEHNTTHFAYYP